MGKILQSVYITQAVKVFLEDIGKKQYPQKKGTTVASEILTKYCIDNGMSIRSEDGKVK